MTKPYRQPANLTELERRTPYAEFSCSDCPRRGRYAVGRLRAQHGDIDVRELMERLSADCPRRQVDDYYSMRTQYNRCGVCCPTLVELWREHTAELAKVPLAKPVEVLAEGRTVRNPRH